MNLICQLSAPPYAIKCLSNGYFIIAGGGGAAKTGVKNFVALYQLRKRDSGEFYAILLHEHTPEGCAIMNFAAIGQAETCVLLLGEDMFCKEYLLRRKVSSAERPHSSSEFPGRSRSRSASGTLRYRGLSMSEEAPNPEETLFELIELRRVQTCSKPQSAVTSQPSAKKNEDDTYQTCVRLSSDLSYLITGCSDGQVNVHRYVDDVLPTVRSFHILPVTATGGKIGSGENVAIEDLDVSPAFGSHAELSVVASGSARCAVHRVSDGAPIKELSLDERAATDCGAFRFRNVRYSVYVSEESANTNRNRVLLISTHRRLKQTRADRRAFLIAAWSCSVYGTSDEVSPNVATHIKLKRILYPFVGCIRVYDDDPATLAVNDNGHLVGVGTQDGAVHVLKLNYTHVDAPDGRTVDAHASFFPIYRVRDVHATFVTGIAFLPTAVSDQERCDALLLSQSVDLRVMSHAVHALSPRRAALNRACSVATICIRLLVALLAIYVFFLVAARAFVAMHERNLDTDTNNWTTVNPLRPPNAVDDTRHSLEPGHSESHSEL